MIRLTHVISDLETGGAEIMLTRLVSAMDPARFTSTVISLAGLGDLGETLRAAGATVHVVDCRRGWQGIRAVPRLVATLRATRPTLAQSWLYHADFLTLLASPVIGRTPLVWNVRCSNMDLGLYSLYTRWILRALARCSARPAAVVVNSEAGRVVHERLGYRPRRWSFIPNGFEVDRFHPDPGAKATLRGQLDLPAGAVLVSLIARVDPMKAHEDFLAAARLVADTRPQARFVLIGRGTEFLSRRIAELGLASRVHAMGHRTDVDRMLPGVDIACLSSRWGEGFPNVIGEAMACGIPCVTTDVGDARAIVGDTGLVVRPRDPSALAAAIVDLVDRGADHRAALGSAARTRIAREYTLATIVSRYEALYTDLAAPGRGR